MSHELKQYLVTIQRILRPLNAADRADILREIEASIQEMQRNGLTDDDILTRLGDAKMLARGYLSNLLERPHASYSVRHFLRMLAFFSCVGLSGAFILPFAIVVPVLYLSGIICFLAGPIYWIERTWNLGIPNAGQIQFEIGGTNLSPITALIVALALGALLIFIGWSVQRILLWYCRTVSKASSTLHHKGQYHDQ